MIINNLSNNEKNVKNKNNRKRKSKRKNNICIDKKIVMEKEEYTALEDGLNGNSILVD